MKLQSSFFLLVILLGHISISQVFPPYPRDCSSDHLLAQALTGCCLFVRSRENCSTKTVYTPTAKSKRRGGFFPSLNNFLQLFIADK